MDGIEALQQIRCMQLTAMPEVIMVTAYGREDAIRIAHERGVEIQTALSKPVTPSNLFEAICEALGKSNGLVIRKEARLDEHIEFTKKLNGARVLLVEDNDMNQELAIELLNNAGMSVVLAKHGQEALDILHDDPQFDGILMDCQMPIMDGYTATRLIRADPLLKKIPVIAMTANTMADDKTKVLEAGMCDHIAKPLNVKLMFSTLAKWIVPLVAKGDSPTTDLIRIKDKSSLNGQGLFERIQLPNIDTKLGLSTVLSNEALYLRFLIKFYDSQRNFADVFSLAQKDKDVTSAERCAHSLRSSAATIGAMGVQKAAQELEQACKSGSSDADIIVLLGNALDELRPVLEGLQLLVEENQTKESVTKTEIDLVKLTEVRTRLLYLLEIGDSVAIDVYTENKELIQAAYPTVMRSNFVKKTK